jgi:hypothetical protein
MIIGYFLGQKDIRFAVADLIEAFAQFCVNPNTTKGASLNEKTRIY